MNRSCENAINTIDDLRKDARVVEAEKLLKNAGFSDEWWEGLLERILNLPYQHERASRETRSEAATRRRKLAEKMKKLADEMDNDIELRNFFPAIRGSKSDKDCFLLNTWSGNGLLSLGEWVRECAELLEEMSLSGKDKYKFSTRFGLSLKSFVIRGVYGLIDHYLAIGHDLKVVTTKRAKNKETALLASAILGKQVTAHQVTKIHEKVRRSYFKEKGQFSLQKITNRH